MDLLRTVGWCPVGKLLSAHEVEDVHRHFLKKDMRLPNQEAFPTNRREAIPIGTNIGEYEAADVVEAPHLGRIANHPDVLARVAGYLEVPPTIQYYTSWWSFAGRKAPKEAQMYHFDRACYRFLKLFVFLTDVTMGSGPHCYVEGSGRHAEWQKRLDEFRRTDPQKADHIWSKLQVHRKEDAEVEACFGLENIRHLCGRAGEAFLVNTAGFHKGILPKSSDRLVFQALYTMLPTIKHGAPRIPCAGYYQSIAHPERVDPAYLRYVNRLIVDDTTD